MDRGFHTDIAISDFSRNTNRNTNPHQSHHEPTVVYSVNSTSMVCVVLCKTGSTHFCLTIVKESGLADLNRADLNRDQNKMIFLAK